MLDRIDFTDVVHDFIVFLLDIYIYYSLYKNKHKLKSTDKWKYAPLAY